MSKGFSQHFIDPDKSAYNIYSVQSSTNDITMSPKITSPVLCRWRETFVNIPVKLNYTHILTYFNDEKK